MASCFPVNKEKALRHEEDRKRLLYMPWGNHMDMATPISQQARSGTKPKVTSTLDHLLCPACRLEGELSPFSTISSVSWTGSGSPIRTLSASNEEEYPILDGLLQILWSDQNATLKDLNRLENFVITRSDTKQLLLRGWQSTSSQLSSTRAAGYSLLELICKHHSPLSGIQRNYVWISILSFGGEKEELPRRLQMKALTTLLGPRGDITGLNDTLTQILSWIGEAISHPAANDLTTLTECHDIIKSIITYNIYRLEEDQIDQIVRAYCDLVSRSVDSSERNAGASSQDVATTLGVAMLVQIIEFILAQDLIPESVVNTLVETLCLVMGLGGESTPSAFGMLSQNTEGVSNEAYQSAALAILGLLGGVLPGSSVHDLIPDGTEERAAKIPATEGEPISAEFSYGDTGSGTIPLASLYRLPVLENLEDILRYSGDHSLLARIGAVNAICERVWLGLVAYFEDGSHDGIRGDREDILVPLDIEITILQEIPEEWLERPGSDALFTRLIKVVGQFVHTFDFETSPSVRRFMSMTMSRIATLVTKFNYPDGSPYLLVTSQPPDHASGSVSSPLLNEIETLLARFFAPPCIPPYLVNTILTMSKHLHDQDLLAAIAASRKQLSPVHVDWAQYFFLHLKIYIEETGRSLACRRVIILAIEKTHGAIVDVAVFRNEIHERLVVLLGKSLPEEHDKEILHSVFRILSQELLATISAECSEERNVHLHRICDGWIDLESRECRCRPRNQGGMLLGSPTPNSSDCWRHALAIKFLTNAFNKMVFADTPTESNSAQSPGASEFYLYLFGRLLALIRPIERPYRSCVKARLAILQWMLRIRADSKHRVFMLVGDLPEVVSLAQMAQRADTSTAPFWMYNDVDFDQQNRTPVRRRRNGSSISSPTSPRTQRPRSINGSVRDIMFIPTFGTPTGDADCRENVETPNEFYWYFPDVLMVDLTEEMKRPSRAISTPASNGGYDPCVTLPVHLYLSTITEIITHSRDWEIVSYILCHLPIQLANKRVFYGPDTNRSMRQLVVAVCASIKGNELYHRMRNMNPPDLPASAVQAVLYQSLTVLLGYHNWLQPLQLERDNELNLNSLIVDSLIHGLSGGVHARRPCLEALSMAVYRVPEEIAKRSALIVEKFTSFATNPFNSLQILEYLIIVGYTPNLHVGIFQDVDYYRVFGLALMNVQHYIRPDAETITTLDGKESYALAQHVYRTSFVVFYIWFLSMKLPDRAKFVPFIVSGLQDANGKGKTMDSAIEICLDWLLQNTYGNVDPVPWSWFMYTSVAFPGYGSRAFPSDSTQRHEAQMENVADIKAWKLGNAIMVVSIMKQPSGWARVVVHRPAGKMELFCHVEKVRRFAPSDGFDDFFKPIDVNTVRDIDCDCENSQDYEGALRSLIMPLMFNSTEPWDASQLRAYPDINQLNQTLGYLQHTPVVDPHRVGVLYVAPGQMTEEDILSNTHGSLTYAHFLSRLTQVVDLSSIDEKVFARGLQTELHGKYTRAWMDDIAAINFHVATMMPNIGDNTSKKGPIGNDAVKIIWNDGGRPYDFTTFRSAFNLINIVIEPQSPASTSAYRTSLDGFLKITLQVAPGVPRLTPIGDFKMVRLEYLPVMMRHFSLFACLLCESWTSTGCDGPERAPLETNWKARLACIERTEKYLESRTGMAQNGQ